MSNMDIAGRVLLGVAGWDWPGWQAEFYPEGLPDDWHIAYYASRFRCVWIGHEVWSRWSTAEAETWLSETPDYFRFVLEASPDGRPVPDVLAPRLGRMCPADDQRLVWFDAATDLAELSTRLRAADFTAGDIFLLSRDGNLARIEQVNNLLQLLGL